MSGYWEIFGTRWSKIILMPCCELSQNILLIYFFISAILQRTTVGIGQMKIQGVATCQYLCMDECGLLYGSVSV